MLFSLPFKQRGGATSVDDGVREESGQFATKAELLLAEVKIPLSGHFIIDIMTAADKSILCVLLDQETVSLFFPRFIIFFLPFDGPL